MDYSPIFNEVLKVIWWLLPIAVLIGILKSPWFKGFIGEQIVRLSARFWLPKEAYHSIHNVILPTLDGSTQIDHIFVSCFGIFVVETKNMSGWIFGSEKQAQWTQKIYRKSFGFQNPLRQNFKHVNALESALGIPEQYIHSVVVFVGGSTFKTQMPPNITYGGAYVFYIKSFQEPVFVEAQVEEIVARIEVGRLERSRVTHREHVNSLKSRIDRSEKWSCPKCGSRMILRTAKRGDQAGKKFLGCSAYPKCRVVQNVT